MWALKAPALQQRGSRSCVVHASTSRQIDPDNANILVAGGGGTALFVTKKLVDMGSWVFMLQRSDTRRVEIEKMMARVVRGDALSETDVAEVFDQIEDLQAVVSCIGGTPADPSPDSQGNINLIRAAAKAGVKRFVLVTSIGAGDSKDAPPKQVYDVLKRVLEEKTKAEEELKSMQSEMDFTIIRPGGLKQEPATGTGVLSEDTNVCGAIHREDVAELAVRALFSPKAANKVLAAVDKNQLMEQTSVKPFDL
eukprot:jgi/Astpho2/5923/Aster-02411